MANKTNKTNGEHGAFAAADATCIQDGLTKREYFAAAALQGMLAGLNPIGHRMADIAFDAVQIADALIAELNRERDYDKD